MAIGLEASRLGLHFERMANNLVDRTTLLSGELCRKGFSFFRKIGHGSSYHNWGLQSKTRHQPAA